MKNYIGMDVAKPTLALALPATTCGWTITTVSNTPERIYALLRQLPGGTHCILEATGSYSVLVT